MAEQSEAEIRVERAPEAPEAERRTDPIGEGSPPLVDRPYDQLPPSMSVRDEDLEPHAGLRYVARLFKVLSLLLLLLLVAEVILGLVQQGGSAVPNLLVEATRLIVFAGLLWGMADLALMLIESNHDLRATRILVGRLNGRIQRMEEGTGTIPPRPTAPRSDSER